METLIDLGVDRVLTSGMEKTAEEGLPLLRELQSRYGGRIEILPGSGINEENAVRIMQEAGVSQVHSSCKGISEDQRQRERRYLLLLMEERICLMDMSLRKK